MEIVILIIMGLVSLSLVLKLTYLPLYGRLAVVGVCALFVGLSWESASEQSKTQIADWLENPELMLNMAVLLTVDVFIQITFCILNGRLLYGEKLSRGGKIVGLITLWVPGILIFPTLYALLVEVIFAFPGSDFSTLAWTLALAVFIAGGSIPSLVRWIIPEKDLRLELLFMINALIGLLGVVATVNGRTAVSGTNSVEWAALLGVVALIFIGSIAGLVITKIKNSHK